MEFLVLGPLEIRSGETAITIARARERALLSLLLINANTPLTDEVIIDALWGDGPPRNPKAALQTAISRLRGALNAPDSLLVRSGDGYSLVVAPDSVDYLRFESLMAEAGAQSDPGKAIALLDEALTLWRGAAYSDVRYEDFAQSEIRRLDELRADAAETKVAHRIDMGEHRAVIPDLEALVHRYPLRESLWAKLMLSLYRAGRQAEALRVYQRARTAIGEASGLEPGSELTRLEEAILMREVDQTTPSPDREPRPAPAPSLNLPEPLTSFVGRDRDLAVLTQLLEQDRLISLVGPAGVGKTRLAVRLARTVQDEYPGGVFFIALDKTDSAERLNDVATAAFSLPDRPVAGPQQLAEMIRSQPLLIILDNCEHILLGAAEFTSWLLRQSESVTIVTTSRQRLGTGPERVWHVSPLPLTTDSAPDQPTVIEPALALFLDRMAAVRPDLSADDPDLRSAAKQIVKTLDGLPLAIELAASQCYALSPLTIARQLEDQLALKASRNPLASERHQTLETAVEWSLRLLGEEQRRCFAALAVIPESFNPEAVEALCTDSTPGAAADPLFDLVEQSLVERVASPPDAPRFRLLWPIRTVARKQLDEGNSFDDLLRRYVGWLADRADHWWLELNGPQHRAVRQEILTERWNLLAAIDWAVTHEPAVALRLLAGPRYLWVAFGLRWTAIAALRAALAATPERNRVRARALCTLGLLASLSSALPTVTRKTNRFDIPALIQDPGSRPPEDSQELGGLAAADEAAAIAEELGEQGLLAYARSQQGANLDRTTHAAEAERLHLEAIELFNAAGLPRESVSAQAFLARLLLARGEYNTAEGIALETLRIRTEIDHLTGQLMSLDMLARIARSQSRDRDAIEHYRRALEVATGESIAPAITANIHTELAYLAMNLGDAQTASQELGLALVDARSSGHRRIVGAVRLAQAQLAIGESQHDTAHGYLDEALSLLEESGDQTAVAYALGLWGLLQHVRSDRYGAHELFLRSLETQEYDHDSIALARAFEGLAALASEGHEDRRAAVLLGAAKRQREEGRTPSEHWYSLLRFRQIELGTTEFEQALSAGYDMSREEAIEFAGKVRV